MTEKDDGPTGTLTSGDAPSGGDDGGGRGGGGGGNSKGDPASIKQEEESIAAGSAEDATTTTTTGGGDDGTEGGATNLGGSLDGEMVGGSAADAADGSAAEDGAPISGPTWTADSHDGEEGVPVPTAAAAPAPADADPDPDPASAPVTAPTSPPALRLGASASGGSTSTARPGAVSVPGPISPHLIPPIPQTSLRRQTGLELETLEEAGRGSGDVTGAGAGAGAGAGDGTAASVPTPAASRSGSVGTTATGQQIPMTTLRPNVSSLALTTAGLSSVYAQSLLSEGETLIEATLVPEVPVELAPAQAVEYVTAVPMRDPHPVGDDGEEGEVFAENGEGGAGGGNANGEGGGRTGRAKDAGAGASRWDAFRDVRVRAVFGCLLVTIVAVVGVAVAVVTSTMTTTTAGVPDGDAADLLILHSDAIVDEVRRQILPLSGAKIDSAGTPQHLAYEWLLTKSDDDLTVILDDHGRSEEEREAEPNSPTRLVALYVLAVLYHSTDGPNWIDEVRFLSEEHECTWQGSSGYGYFLGLECDNGNEDDDARLGRIAQLSLWENGVRGTLPTELGLLGDLHALGFHGNDIKGTITTELGRLSKLTFLALDANDLTGTIPDVLGQPLLDALLLGDNRLEGTIPDNIGNSTNLRYAKMQDNLLTGTVPESFANLGKLEQLWLQGNSLAGSVEFICKALVDVPDFLVDEEIECSCCQ